MRILTDNRVAGSVATATAGTGVAEWLRWIPEDIGKLATLVGILLSLVLIATRVSKAVIEWQKHRVEMEQFRLSLQAPPAGVAIKGQSVGEHGPG